MTDNVHWVVQFDIKGGKLGELKALIAEMVKATEANEPGTLNYEWFVDSADQNGHIYERYVDSAAALTHLATFGEKFAGRFMAAVEPTHVCVYGNPSAELKGVLDGFGAAYMHQIGGFAR